MRQHKMNTQRGSAGIPAISVREDRGVTGGILARAGFFLRRNCAPLALSAASLAMHLLQVLFWHKPQTLR